MRRYDRVFQATPVTLFPLSTQGDRDKGGSIHVPMDLRIAEQHCRRLLLA